MKLNIENKILMPFVLLFLMSQTVLLATSFRNDYKLIIDNQFRSMDESVRQLVRSLDHGFANGELNGENRAYILDKVDTMMGHTIIIEWNGKELLNGAGYELSIDSLEEMGTVEGIAHLQNSDYLFSYYYYAPLGWSMTVLSDKTALLSFFYESYKYNILTGIIFLTLSLQITVFVAANITKPIKRLVKFCLSIGEGHKDRIYLNRQDEIGQLNEAFNEMLDQLDDSMEELVTVKNYNQNVLNSIEKGIMTYDAKGAVISYNPFATKILEACQGFKSEGITLEDLLRNQMEVVKDKGEGTYRQVLLSHDERGEYRYLDCYISTMKNQSDIIQGYICSFNDITERKLFERDVQRLERLATAGRLASGVAHEIRNPLTGMRTSMQVLKKRLGDEAEEKNIVLIHRTIGEIDRMNKMISDLLGYAKPKVFRPSHVRVEESVNSVISLLKSDMNRRGITFEASYPSIGWALYMDKDHLHQILLNLIKNAMDAIDEEGAISLVCKTDQKLGHSVIEIKDNGRGIAADDLDKIYDPFFTRKNDGTGLGLSVVHELMNRNGGKIRISSLEGQGSQVFLSFTVEETADE